MASILQCTESILKTQPYRECIGGRPNLVKLKIQARKPTPTHFGWIDWSKWSFTVNLPAVRCFKNKGRLDFWQANNPWPITWVKRNYPYGAARESRKITRQGPASELGQFSQGSFCLVFVLCEVITPSHCQQRSNKQWPIFTKHVFCGISIEIMLWFEFKGHIIESPCV